MIKISREARDYLEKEKGLRFNKDIHGSFSKVRKYYLVETPRNLKLLQEFKNSK